MPSHTFRARVEWRAGGEGIAASTHRVEFEGATTIELSAAPQYKGDPSRPNPELLFLASLASCQLLSFLALASRAAVKVLAYDDAPEATLAIKDRRMRITEVVLRPRITVAEGSDEAKVRRLAEAAHEACFIANSVASEVRVEAEVLAGPG